MKKPMWKTDSRFKAAALAVVAMAAITTTQAAKVKQLFWNEPYSIMKMNTDGTGPRTYLKGRDIQNLTVHAGSNVSYWWDKQSESIYRSDLDGGNSELVLHIPTDQLQDMVIDSEGKELYYSIYNKGIKKVVLTTGIAEWVVENTNPNRLDFDNDRLFWCDFNSKSIESINPDGSDRQVIIQLDYLRTLSLDEKNDVIYYGDHKSMMKVNYDGTGQTQLFYLNPEWNLSEAEYLQGRMYMSNRSGDGSVFSTDMSGGDIQNLYSFIETAGRIEIGSDSRVYMVDPTKQSIFSTNGAGENRETNLQCDGVNKTYGLAVNENNGAMYVARRNAILGKTADLKGSPVLPITGWQPDGVQSLSFTSNKVYWVDQESKVFRADLDGKNIEKLPCRFDSPTAVYVDTTGGDIYVQDWFGKVYRTDLDGVSDPEYLFTAGGRWGSIFYYAEIGRMFFSDERDNVIISCNPDGSDKKVIAAGTTRMSSFAIDKESNSIYWSDGAAIYSANLDGDYRTLLHVSDNMSGYRGVMFVALGSVESDTEVELAFACNDVSYWDAVSGGLSVNTGYPNRDAVLELSESSGSIEVKTVPLASADFVNPTNSLGVDLFVGANAANQGWLGAVQVIFKSTDAGIWYANGGTIQLNTLRKDDWNSLNFSVPQNVLNAMNGDYSDLTVTFKFNTAAGADNFLLDNLRFK